MRLSRTVAYALRATMQLAQSTAMGPVPCNLLAAEGKMPERFLLQVLGALVRQGILRSTRGVGGGYVLQRSPVEISLLELIEALDGPVIATLPDYDGLSSDSKSKLVSALSDVTERARRDLHSIKLAHLLPSADGHCDEN